MNLCFVPLSIVKGDCRRQGRDERQRAAPLTPAVSAPHMKNAAHARRIALSIPCHPRDNFRQPPATAAIVTDYNPHLAHPHLLNDDLSWRPPESGVAFCFGPPTKLTESGAAASVPRSSGVRLKRKQRSVRFQLWRPIPSAGPVPVSVIKQAVSWSKSSSYWELDLC
jgi:hypothetical protein